MKPEENYPPIRESQQIGEKELSSDHALLWNIVNDVIESPYLVHSLIILYCVDIFYLITAFVMNYGTVIHSLIKDKHTIFKFTFFYCCSSQNWLVCFMTLFNSFVKPLKCFNVLNNLKSLKYFHIQNCLKNGRIQFVSICWNCHSFRHCIVS